MNDKIKQIAVNKLIELKGLDFINKNNDNFAISYQDLVHQYIVTFLISESPNIVTEEISNSETQISRILQLAINKSGDKCIILKNTI